MDLNLSDNRNRSGGLGGIINNMNQDFKEREVAEQAKRLGLGYIDLRRININADLLEHITEEESKKVGVIPFFRMGNKIKIAFRNPNNPQLEQIIERLKTKRLEIIKYLCSQESLEHAQNIFASKLHHEERSVVANTDTQRVENVATEIANLSEIPERMKTMRTDEALNLLHEEILKLNASDLHIEPKKDFTRVRARIDGTLIDFFELSNDVAQGLTRQIKYNSHLKFNITNIPQDGKYSFESSDRKVDVRVSTIPANHGEGLVMRFLDPKKGLVPLEKLGFYPRDLAKIEEAFRATNGLILVTGPTGSGKTTTLHSALSRVNSPEKKIITLEDPVEFEISGIVQCEVDEEAGFTFAGGLHSILRQDPDIVLIGEIRDLHTAETAVQASLTGHLVLSTLHTNSAADAIPRLLNIGVAGFILAPALRCIIAQRLVRNMCKECLTLVPPKDTERQEIEKVVIDLQKRGYDIQVPEKIPMEKGCDHCSNTSYRGQSVAAEVLIINSELEDMMQHNVRSVEVLEAAKKMGMCTMWEAGIVKVVNAETTLQEVIRRVGRVS